MSIEFNWEKLSENSAEIEQNVCEFLNQQFQSVKLPEFISSLAVSSFKLGSTPPEIVLKHFSDPFPEFYEADAELDMEEAFNDEGDHIDGVDYEKHQAAGSVLGRVGAGTDETTSESVNGDTPVSSSSIPSSFSSCSLPEIPPIPDVPDSEPELDETVIRHDDSSSLNYRLVDNSSSSASSSSSALDGMKSPFDVQSYIELKYDGDMQLSVSATLLVNYPAPSFISLPIAIRVSRINIHALLVAAYIRKRVHITVMSDVHNRDIVPAEEVDVIKSMKIESEIGDHTENGALLRNVGKAEKFVIEQLRNVIRDELVWPGWLTLEI